MTKKKFLLFGKLGLINGKVYVHVVVLKDSVNQTKTYKPLWYTNVTKFLEICNEWFWQ